ncbi:MAG: hypothetical protein K8I30_20480, partial [Anaerolineae bacterium]|nr:hypothetical protein [Anaerolineae bacterium]
MFRLFDSFLFTFERIWQHRMLVLWALIGLSAASVLALSMMLYIDAVNTGLLESQLTEPPYAFRFRYLGAWNGNVTQADINTATGAIQDGFVDTISLPTEREVRYARGAAWTMRLANNQSLGAFTIGYLEGTEDQMAISAGEWPPESPAEDGVIPVMASEKMLYNMGVQVGDIITATLAGRDPVQLQIAALWSPINAADPRWIFPPKFFDEVMLVQPDDLWRLLEGIERPVEESAWFLIFDGATVRTSDVDAMLGRIIDGER